MANWRRGLLSAVALGDLGGTLYYGVRSMRAGFADASANFSDVLLLLAASAILGFAFGFFRLSRLQLQVDEPNIHRRAWRELGIAIAMVMVAAIVTLRLLNPDLAGQGFGVATVFAIGAAFYLVAAMTTSYRPGTTCPYTFNPFRVI